VVIFIFGFFPEHINDVATNRNVGGGPFESMSRTLKAEMPTTQSCPRCGDPKAPHRVCPSCGYYRDEAVFEVEAD